MLTAMMTDARESAARYYAESDRDMNADAAALGTHPLSLVILMPELVVLAKQVRADLPETWENLAHIESEPDAWYIHLLTGDFRLLGRLAAALRLHPWVCFRRGLRGKGEHRLPMRRLIRHD